MLCVFSFDYTKYTMGHMTIDKDRSHSDAFTQRILKGAKRNERYRMQLSQTRRNRKEDETSNSIIKTFDLKGFSSLAEKLDVNGASNTQSIHSDDLFRHRFQCFSFHCVIFSVSLSLSSFHWMWLWVSLVSHSIHWIYLHRYCPSHFLAHSVCSLYC